MQDIDRGPQPEAKASFTFEGLVDSAQKLLVYEAVFVETGLDEKGRPVGFLADKNFQNVSGLAIREALRAGLTREDLEEIEHKEIELRKSQGLESIDLSMSGKIFPGKVDGPGEVVFAGIAVELISQALLERYQGLSDDQARTYFLHGMAPDVSTSSREL